jgi:hypothetical protein
MFTRKDYLDGNCTHQEYYSQFVTDGIKRLVTQNFDIKTLQKQFEKDEYFNGMELRLWDKLTHLFQCNKVMCEHGDYATLAGRVCILKEAARQIVEIDERR